MVNRVVIASILLLVVSVASAQSARDYFEEIRSANGFSHYSDQYVCFPDTDTGGFAVLAKTKDIARAMEANGEPAKQSEHLEDHLIVHTFFKGVANELQIFDKANGSSDTEWRSDFAKPFHGRAVYMVNWDTGRYRYLIFALDHSAQMPAAEVSGKCQLIHPGSTPNNSFKADASGAA